MSGGVLVTGGRGFAGTHLLTRLGPNAAAVDVDVTHADALAAAVAKAPPRAIAHLAAASSVAESWQRGASVWHVNVVGTVNVLDAMREAAPRGRTLIVSTGEVYGETRDGPASEGRDIAPTSPYAASKAAAEIACARAARVEGQDVVIARPFQHIGPGQDERFAIGSWTRQIARLELEGGGVLEVGDLTVERDLTDVRDVVRAYELLLDDGVPAGTYNIASGRPIPLQHVVEILVGYARGDIAVRQNPRRLRRVDVRVVAGDASQIAEVAGWGPEIPLERTLADALEDARRLVREERERTP